MMWGYYDGGWSLAWMTAMMLLFWGGLGVVIVLGLRAFAARRRDDSAVDVLRRRLASGEISQEEFEQTRHVLHG